MVCGYDREIYDVDFRCPGGFHDAKVWRFSKVKTAIEQRWPIYFLAGDEGYPKSDVLVIPYPANQADNDPSKRLFNIR